MSKFLAKNRTEVKRLSIQDESGAVLAEFSIVKPTLGDQMRVAKAATLAGEMDAKGEPVGAVGQLMIAARTVAETFMDPETGTRAFQQADAEAILDTAWFNAYLEQEMAEGQKSPKAEGPKAKARGK